MMDTGIARLDQILGGGYPLSSSIMVIGPPSIEKELMGLQFVASGIVSGDASFIVSTTRTEEETRSLLKTLGVKESAEFLFIDASGVGVGKSVNVNHLEGILATIEDFLQNTAGKQVRGYIEILSPALMTNPLSTVYEFNFRLHKLLKLYPSVSVFTLEEGMHDPQSINAIEHLFDGIIEVKLLEEGNKIINLLKIRKMKGKILPEKYYKFDVKVPEL